MSAPPSLKLYSPSQMAFVKQVQHDLGGGDTGLLYPPVLLSCHKQDSM